MRHAICVQVDKHCSNWPAGAVPGPRGIPSSVDLISVRRVRIVISGGFVCGHVKGCQTVSFTCTHALALRCFLPHSSGLRTGGFLADRFYYRYVACVL